MYEPEWLSWWRIILPEIKNYMMQIYFPDWKNNPMNSQIKAIYSKVVFDD